LVRLAALVSYLLANRHQIPDKIFIVCLALAKFNPKPTQRFTSESLVDVLQVNSVANVRVILNEMRHRGLVHYDKGSWAEPGYLFYRVGPEEDDR
jgi:hypothetical protein